MALNNAYAGSITAQGNRQGFADYNDLATATTPITLVSDTWTTLTNDGAGTFTNTTFLPTGVSSLLDTSTGALDCSELELGDSVIIRQDFTVDQTTNNSLLESRYQAGTGGGAYTIEKVLQRLDSGTTRTYRFSLTADFIYMGDANTRDNPIIPQIKLSGGGTVVNAGVVIEVVKRN